VKQTICHNYRRKENEKSPLRGRKSAALGQFVRRTVYTEFYSEHTFLKAIIADSIDYLCV